MNQRSFSSKLSNEKGKRFRGNVMDWLKYFNASFHGFPQSYQWVHVKYKRGIKQHTFFKSGGSFPLERKSLIIEQPFSAMGII